MGNMLLAPGFWALYINFGIRSKLHRLTGSAFHDSWVYSEMSGLRHSTSRTDTSAETTSSDPLTSQAMLDPHGVSCSFFCQEWVPFSFLSRKFKFIKPTQLHHLRESVSTDLETGPATCPSSPWLSALDAALTTGPTSGPSFLTVSRAHHINVWELHLQHTPEPNHFSPRSPPLDPDLPEFSSPTVFLPPCTPHPLWTMSKMLRPEELPLKPSIGL